MTRCLFLEKHVSKNSVEGLNAALQSLGRKSAGVGTYTYIESIDTIRKIVENLPGNGSPPKAPAPYQIHLARCTSFPLSEPASSTLLGNIPRTCLLHTETQLPPCNHELNTKSTSITYQLQLVGLHVPLVQYGVEKRDAKV